TQEVRMAVAKLALDGLNRVADKVDQSTSKEATMLSVHQLMGKLFQELGEGKKAKEQFTKALEIARLRVVIRKGSDASRGNLASILRSMGEMTMETDRDLEAVLKYYREALQVREDILHHPSPEPGTPAKRFYVLLYMAEDCSRVGATIYRLGDPAAALPYF